MTLTNLLLFGGVCHFGILLASALVPKVLDWRNELARLHELLRHLVWVHGAFVVLVIVGFGVVSVTCAADLAAGTRLGRAVCGLVSVFWLARLGIQFFLFDARPYLTSAMLKIGYHGLTVVFTYLAAVYGYAALFAVEGRG